MKYRYLMAVAIFALVSSVAYAGGTQPAKVDVDLDNGFAQGDMVTARYSSNKDEFIGCGTRNLDDGLGGIFSFGFCQAEDTDGDRVVCFTENAALVDKIGGISDFSFITFSFADDGAGGFTCTRIGFSTQSFYLPRALNANGNNGQGNGNN